MTDTSTTRPNGRIRGRKRVGVPALSLLAAVVGSASLAGLAGATSPTGEQKFDPATWKPTLEAPLPPMEGPLSFHLSDEPAYWYDNGRPRGHPAHPLAGGGGGRHPHQDQVRRGRALHQ